MNKMNQGGAEIMKLQAFGVDMLMGDTRNQVILNPDLPESLEVLMKMSELIFKKKPKSCNYLSDEVDLNFLTCVAPLKIYSSVGEISYFPELKRMAINFCDEEETLGQPRIVIGKTKTNICCLEGLTAEEKTQLCFEFSYRY